MEYSTILKVTEDDSFESNLIHREMFADYYLRYMISMFLLKNKNCDILFIQNELNKIYGKNSVILKELIQFLDNNFIEKVYEDGIYELKQEDKYLLNSVTQFIPVLRFLNTYSIDELCDIISSLLKKPRESDLPYIFPYVLSLMKHCIKISIINDLDGAIEYENNELESYSTFICLAKYYDWLHTYDEKYSAFYNVLGKIDKSYNDVNLNFFIENSYVNEILRNAGFEKISDLACYYSSEIVLLLVLDDRIEYNFKMLKTPFNELLIKKINRLFNSLNQDYRQFINFKTGIETGSGMSNHEVAMHLKKDLGYVKQEERDAVRCIKRRKLNLINMLLVELFEKADFNNEYVVKVDKIREIINDDVTWRYVIYLYDVLDLKYKYDSKSHTIYNSEKITIKNEI